MQLLDVIESNGNATSEVKRIFTIDTTGPTISNTFPSPGDIIGGVVPISAMVTDGSGVLASSVIAVIGDESGRPGVHAEARSPDRTGAYSTLFDTAQPHGLPAAAGDQPLHRLSDISFRAVDSVGNQSVLGYDFAVDNVAPISDLDPPQMRPTSGGGRI